MYDNDCDAACNICNAERAVAHAWDNDCDASCNVCNTARTVAAHLDSNGDEACDTYGAFVEKPGLSGGAGLGIGIGATAAVLTGGFSLYWFVIKKKKVSDLI